jgi:hypothetical protein
LTDQATVWQALGIPPTREIGDIRRAYAARLKECHPEENPDAFQRLREAYEAALRAARGAATAAGSAPPTAVKEAVGPVQSQTTTPEVISSQPASEDQRHVEAAIARLEGLLKDPGQPDPIALESALNAVLDTPGAFHVGSWNALERRLARLLVESAAKSDPILDMVVQRLGWARADVVTARAKEVVAAVTRVADLATVTKLRSGTDPDARAFQLLSQPAPKSWMMRRVKTLYFDHAVRDFFNKTLRARPTLAQWLDKASVDIWVRTIGRPHVSARGLAAMPIFSATAMVGVYAAGELGILPTNSRGAAFLLALWVGPFLVLAKLYAFSWPATLLFKRLKGKEPPPWMRWGWLAAGALSVLMVSSLPATWPVAALALVLAVGLLPWATIAAHPVFVAEGLGFYQKLKLALMENPAVLFWTGMVAWGIGLPASIVTAGAFGASAIAGRTMAKIWKFGSSRSARLWSLVALSLVAMAAGYALWRSSDSAVQFACSTALVTIASLMQRPIRLTLTQALIGRWAQVMVFATFALVLALGGAGLSSKRLAIQIAGTYVLLGAVTTVCFVVYSEATAGRLLRRAPVRA